MKSVIDDVKPSRDDLLGTTEAEAAPAATTDRKV
jgi:hypothetical protein